MAVTISNHITIPVGKSQMVFVEYENVHHKNAAEIAENTAQTWQPGRDSEETLANTLQGKIAEDIFETYLSLHYPEIHLLSYDEIRNDNYKKHAAFDFLIWTGDCCIDDIIKSIQTDISNSYKSAYISKQTRNLCKTKNVKFLEVKSTKIAYRHKKKCGFDIGDYNNTEKISKLAAIIQNDDFLIYPQYCRSTSDSEYSVKDYIETLVSKGYNISDEQEMLKFERKNQVCDIFFRVYTDEQEGTGYLVGWTDKTSFYRNAKLKRMPKHKKSELALYFSTPLSTRNNLDNFYSFLNNRT